MVYYYPHRHTDREDTVPSVRAAQQQCIANALSIINDQLELQPYLLGEQLSACDYFLFMLAEWSLPIEQSPLSFKNLAAYLKRMAENPSIRAVCDIEGMDISPFAEGV
nr:glutathione binding-like protein [Pseudoteredinibacter isoporae]